MCVSAFSRTLCYRGSKIAVLTKIVLLFSECSSVLSNSVTNVSKVAVLTEVVLTFYVCFSVLSNSVLPMVKELPY